MTPKQITAAAVIGFIIVSGVLFVPELFYKHTHMPAANTDEIAQLVSAATTPQSHAVTIIRSNTDERGLTCIEFTQDGKEWALDFITKHELDSLKSIK